MRTGERLETQGIRKSSSTRTPRTIRQQMLVLGVPLQ
jgi:hypothetical protein